MTVKSLLAGLLATVVCVSCGGDDPSGAQKKASDPTLAGSADTAKAKPAAQNEMRLPQAPIERPDAAAAAAAGGAGAAAAAATPTVGGGTADTSDMPQVPKEA